MGKTALRQRWPLPANPRPIVLVGAGGIVRDAHLPAYRKAGFEVKGAFDVEPGRAARLQNDWGLETAYRTLEEAADHDPADVVYDLATPPGAIPAILEKLPRGATVLIGDGCVSDVLMFGSQIPTSPQQKERDDIVGGFDRLPHGPRIIG